MKLFFAELWPRYDDEAPNFATGADETDTACRIHNAEYSMLIIVPTSCGITPESTNFMSSSRLSTEQEFCAMRTKSKNIFKLYS